MTKQKQPTVSTNNNHHDITLPGKGDLTEIIKATGEKPAMRGFDPQFQDIVDYIVKITHEIWEERGIGRLYEYYGTNMVIHTTNGEIFGRETVIEGSIQAMAAYPDRRLYAEEVIWTGNDDVGYFSSHRLRHEGTNWGHTEFGDPTGQRVSYRAVADCKVIEGVIVEEWLTRDNLTQIVQLGFDPHQLARAAAHAEADMRSQFSVPSEADRLRGQLQPSDVAPWGSKDFNIGAFVHNAIHEVWNWRLLNKVRDYYADNYICESASNRRFYGQNQFINYILQFMSAFPDLAVHVDHFCALQESENSYRTATRWIMQGTHKGPGIYGKPTGNKIRLMGMTHQIIRDGKFVQEWTVFDEFELLKQIYAGSSSIYNDAPF
ncbi:MAG: ester cyclase [Chloroflexota bacterium]